MPANGRARLTYNDTASLALQYGMTLTKRGKGYTLARNGLTLARPANLREAWETIGHSGDDDEAYHADLSTWSRSMLSVFRSDRQECQAIRAGKMPRKDPTDRMNKGSATHDVLLRPGLFEANYVPIPPAIKVRKGRVWDAFRMMNQGKVWLTAKDFQDVMGMTLAVRGQLADLLAANPIIEKPIYWDCHGLPCKAKPDLLFVSDERRPLIVDIKTSENISGRWFRNQVSRLRYWLQDAHYSRAVESVHGQLPEFWFLAVKSKPPYTPRVFQIERPDRQRALVAHEETVKNVVECLESGDWSNPWQKTATSISLPGDLR